MSGKLILGLIGSLPVDGLQPIHLETPELAIREELAGPLCAALADAGAVDNRLSITEHLGFPLRFNLAGVHLDREFPIDGEFFVQFIPDEVVPAVSADAARIAELEAQLAALQPVSTAPGPEAGSEPTSTPEAVQTATQASDAGNPAAAAVDEAMHGAAA